MSGKNVSLLTLPPGIFRENTQFATGPKWFDGNLMRWFNDILTPVEGWVTYANLAADTYPIRGLFSWFDNKLQAWIAAGSADRVTLIKAGVSPVQRDITPSDLSWAPGFATGYGGNIYGKGAYGKNSPSGGADFDVDALWSFDSWGADLVGVHSQDGRVFYWDPSDPTNYLLQSSTPNAAPWIGTNTTITLNLVTGPDGVAVIGNKIAATATAGTSLAQSGLIATDTSYTVTYKVKQGTGAAISNTFGIYNATTSSLVYAVRLDYGTGVATLAAGSGSAIITAAGNGWWTLSLTVITGIAVGNTLSVFDGWFGAGATAGDFHYSCQIMFETGTVAHTYIATTTTAKGTVLAPISGAFIDNKLCCVTNERHLMLFGGKNHPRRIKWSDEENFNSFTPTETNSAGGFELDTGSAISAVQKITGGILVFTSTDVHIIEYVGAPYFYSKRLLTSLTGILGQNCVTATQNGAIWIGASSFWKYDGSVSQISCSLQTEFFRNSYLERTAAVFLATNNYTQEAWAFYPGVGQTEANRYVLYSYRASPFWSMGGLVRSAMLNPVFQPRPFMSMGQKIYEHERGDTDDGSPRTNVYVTSGYVGFKQALRTGNSGYSTIGSENTAEADKVMRVDRIWDDVFVGVNPAVPYVGASPVQVTLNRKEAPQATIRPYGPIALGTIKGYSVVRLRARLIAITIKQTLDVRWGLGQMMIRLKEGGGR